MNPNKNNSPARSKDSPNVHRRQSRFPAVVLAFVFLRDTNTQKPSDATVIVDDEDFWNWGDYKLELPDDEYSAYLKKRVNNAFFSKRSNDELRSILREEMFVIEKLDDLVKRNRLLLYIASKQLSISYQYTSDYDKMRKLIREIESTLARVDPVLNKRESLEDIKNYGFEKYTQEEKNQSDFFLKTVLQANLAYTRLRYVDSGGAMKTATEIFPDPERDKVLLVIMKTQLWPDGQWDDSDIRYGKAEKTFSHIGENGRDMGLFLKFRWYADMFLYHGSYTSAVSERRALDNILDMAKNIKHDKVFEAETRYICYRIRERLGAMKKTGEKNDLVFELVRYLDERITSPFPRFHYRYTISESKACPPEFSDPDKIVEELRTAVDTTPDGNEKAELLLDNLYSIYDSKTGRGWFFVEILYELINKMQDDDLSKFLYSDKLLGSLDTWGMLNLKDGMYEKVVSMKNKTADVVIPEYWLYLAKKIDSKEDITPEDDVILGRIGWHMYCVAFVQGDFDGAVKFFEIGGISENEKSALLDKIENRFFWSTWDREKDCLRFALKPGLPDNISFVILREMCNYRREHQEGFSPEDAWSAFISLSLNRNTPAEKVFACLRVLEYLPKDIVLEIDPRYIKKYLPYYAKQNISGKLDSEVACELIKKVIDENLEKMADKNFDLVELRLFCNRVADYGSVNDAEVFEMYLRLFETVSGRFNDDPLRNFMYFKRFFSWNYDLLRALPHEKKEEILEMYCKSLKKIPDQPLGDKLDAYTHIIWFATNYGQNESKKRLIDEAFALLNDASDNPEGLKKSPQISVPLAEIERLSKY